MFFLAKLRTGAQQAAERMDSDRRCASRLRSHPHAAENQRTGGQSEAGASDNARDAGPQILPATLSCMIQLIFPNLFFIRRILWFEHGPEILCKGVQPFFHGSKKKGDPCANPKVSAPAENFSLSMVPFLCDLCAKEGSCNISPESRFVKNMNPCSTRGHAPKGAYLLLTMSEAKNRCSGTERRHC